MTYKEILAKPFLNDVKDIKKDKVLLDRLQKKMDEILQNPEHYPPKKYELKGKRAAHVGNFPDFSQIFSNSQNFPSPFAKISALKNLGCLKFGGKIFGGLGTSLNCIWIIQSQEEKPHF